MRFAFLFLILTGCASQAAKAPETFDAASKEPVCARQCLAGYSNCIGAAVGTHPASANNIMVACDAAARQCLNTCPSR